MSSERVPYLSAAASSHRAFLLSSGPLSMQSPPRDQVESILADIVREHLARREAIRIPGLGVFETRHSSSSIERTESGELQMKPPTDHVTFTPEQQ